MADNIASYKELHVWQKAMELSTEIYRIVKLLPKEEQYAMSDQMRRAAVSIPSNIAEGQRRNTKKDFIQFLSIASGSVAELETQLIICKNTGMLIEEETQEAFALCTATGKMLSSLISKLKN